MRFWKQGEDFSNSVHCLGNGSLCVYEKGPEILQVFGPPFGCGTVAGLSIVGSGYSSQSSRIVQTNTWVHKLFYNGKMIGTITDFISATQNVFIREMDLLKAMVWKINLGQNAFFENDDAVILPKGSAIFMEYLSQKDTSVVFFCDKVKIQNGIINIPQGKSVLNIASAQTVVEAREIIDSIISKSICLVRQESENDWKEYISRIKVEIREDAEQREKLLKTVEDVAVLIRSQQSREGSILAGYNYHLGYVRDQFGAFRCLMKLHLYPEAKKVLTFYRDTYKDFGQLHNAQAAGVPGVFHVHENDEVEITGYLILQTIQYYEQTGEEIFFRSMIPLLMKCLEWQVSALHKNMLPFNGDETYIAGAFLNRFVMDEGSAEATMLFILGANKFFEIAPKFQINLDKYKPYVEAAENVYRKNFVVDGKLACNNSERRSGLIYPKKRHGVCVGCNAFGDLTVNSQGYDVCEKCKNETFDYVQIKYFLPAVALVPAYLGTNMFSLQEMQGFCEDTVEDYIKFGAAGKNRVGYEFGYLLFALMRIHADNDLLQSVAKTTLNLVDDVGAWSEYYVKGKPFNTRYRPWESGINLEALLCFFKNSEGDFS